MSGLPMCIVFPILTILFITSVPRTTMSLRLTKTGIPLYGILHKGATLSCHFDLENDSLYAVKWYKDGHEFFRFNPQAIPMPITVFPVVGVSVDTNSSSRNEVQLEPVSLLSKGSYRCEISADAPSFQTVSEEHHMNVMALPNLGPKISGVHPWYNLGDNFSANCHVDRTFPAPKVTWLVNDAKIDASVCSCIDSEIIEKGKALDGTTFYSVTSRLTFQVDSDFFRDGTLVTQCIAEYPKSTLTLKDSAQASIKAGFARRQYLDIFSSGCLERASSLHFPWIFVLIVVMGFTFNR